MGPEPSINTPYVESVVALREETQKLPILELGETHSAVAAGRAEYAIVRLVGPRGDGPDGGLIETRGPDVPDVVVDLVAVVLEGELGVRIGRGGSPATAAAAVEDVEGEEDEHGSRSQEGGSGDREGGDEGRASTEADSGGRRNRRPERWW